VRLGFNTACSLPYPIEDELPAIAAAGFDDVELRTPELRDWLAERSLDELRRLLDAHGLRVGSINALEFVSFRGGDDPALREEAGELFAWARALGAPCVIAVPSPTPSPTTSWDEVVSASVAAMSDLARLAEPLDITVGFEPLGFGWCSVRTVAGACEILDAVRPGNVGLVIDLFHLALGGSALAELDALDGARVPIVHVDDVRIATREATTDADRLLPGQGELPIADVLGRLVRRGFDGLVSLELFTPAYWEWGVEQIAARGYAASAPYLRAVEPR
jgi:2-keto-myo-inositol isomerase